MIVEIPTKSGDSEDCLLIKTLLFCFVGKLNLIDEKQ